MLVWNPAKEVTAMNVVLALSLFVVPALVFAVVLLSALAERAARTRPAQPAVRSAIRARRSAVGPVSSAR
jgi:hypothetical protein